MNEIMQAIAQAEEEAAKIREQARARANGIITKAEEEAADFLKSAEIKAKNLREDGVHNAQLRAAAEYGEAIKKSKEEAVAYADERLQNTDVIANEIVRRIVSGC